MPRILAPSVRENRELRTGRLTDAARALLLSGGPESVTMSDAARAAGISRSSAYEYFSSPADIVAAVVIAELEQYARLVTAATSMTPVPRDVVSSFVAASVRHLSRERAFSLVAAVGTWTPLMTRDDVQRAWTNATDPLARALTDLGAAEVALTTRLALAVIVDAARSASEGKSLEQAIAITTAFILTGGRRTTGAPFPR